MSTNEEDWPIETADDDEVEESNKDTIVIGEEPGYPKITLKKTSDMTQKLIKLIKSQPALWDRTCSQYKDKDAKDRAWQEIIKALFPNCLKLKRTQQIELIHHLSRRWFNVRDAYVKFRKRKSFNKARKPYLYSYLMSFLDPIYNLPPSDITHEFAGEELEYFIEDRLDDTLNECNATNEENVLHEEYLDTYLDEAEATPAKRVKTESLDDNVISILANLLEKEEDEDRAFFKSIIPSVKSLPYDAKIEFRIQVMKLLKNLAPKKKRVKIEHIHDSE